MTESDWLSSEDPVAMLGLRGRGGPSLAERARFNWSDRKLRLFACACCRRVWQQLTDHRSRRAVEVAERFADGDVSAFALISACYAAHDASHSPYPGHGLERDAATAAIWCATERAGEAADGVLRYLASGAIHAALLREIIGNPFRAVEVVKREDIGGGRFHLQKPDGGLVSIGVRMFDADWLTLNDGMVTRLARAAYEDRREDGTLCPARLAVLADALEEAGCQDEAVLRHLRGWERCWLCQRTKSDPARDACSVCGQLGARGPFGKPCAPGWIPLGLPHVIGCHVLDLLLGKF